MRPECECDSDCLILRKLNSEQIGLVIFATAVTGLDSCISQFSTYKAPNTKVYTRNKTGQKAPSHSQRFTTSAVISSAVSIIMGAFFGQHGKSVDTINAIF